MKKSHKSIIKWISIIVGIAILAYGGFKLYHYALGYASKRIRGEAAKGIGEGMGRGIGEGLSPFSFPGKS